MVFTQGRGFVLGASFGLQIRSLRCRVLVCHAADTASLATSFLFGKLFCVAMAFGFGEKRCRKNLPLSAPRLAQSRILTAFNSPLRRCSARLRLLQSSLLPFTIGIAGCFGAPNPSSIHPNNGS